MQIGIVFPYLFPNFSKVDRLSIFKWTPIEIASSISEKSTQFGVYIIWFAPNPALKPKWTSSIETASKPEPSFFNNLNTLILFNAFNA